MLTDPMEAAFFDLDKTVIAKSSVLAFGRPLYREGLLSRSALLKSAYNQAMYRLRGADEARMAGGTPVVRSTKLRADFGRKRAGGTPAVQ